MFNSYVSLPEGMLAVGYLSDEIPPLDPDFVAVLVSHSEILRDNDGNHEVRSAINYSPDASFIIDFTMSTTYRYLLSVF